MTNFQMKSPFLRVPWITCLYEVIATTVRMVQEWTTNRAIGYSTQEPLSVSYLIVGVSNGNT